MDKSKKLKCNVCKNTYEMDDIVEILDYNGSRLYCPKCFKDKIMKNKIQENSFTEITDIKDEVNSKVGAVVIHYKDESHSLHPSTIIRLFKNEPNQKEQLRLTGIIMQLQKII